MTLGVSIKVVFFFRRKEKNDGIVILYFSPNSANIFILFINFIRLFILKITFLGKSCQIVLPPQSNLHARRVLRAGRSHAYMATPLFALLPLY